MKDTENVFLECALCPRNCRADRTGKARGYCGVGADLKVARIALHRWEEPPISGMRGSGTVFFAGCNLGCCFCQNHRISRGNSGREYSPRALADEFMGLEKQGAHNINLVTAAPFVPRLAESIRLARRGGLKIPVVYNSSGYEKVETLAMLEGLVEIYLPDLKFASSGRGERYAGAPDYFNIARLAVGEMIRQCGPAKFDKSGVMHSGVMIRHLVMPGGVRDSCRCLEWIRDHAPPGILVSLMAQYFPCYRAAEYPEINRRLTEGEYRAAEEKMRALGLAGYIQDLEAADESYVPVFDK
ncbi:MAG: radical SAM protein [Bacillota bacterium]